MALEDYENQLCLCAWIAALGDGPKQQLKIFIESARVILTTQKAIWLLINTDFEDVLKKETAEVTLSLYKAVTDPIEAPLKYLVSQTRPFADCPPVSGLASAVKQISDSILGPVHELEADLQDFIESIEINRSQNEQIDNVIGTLDDILDAIEVC